MQRTSGEVVATHIAARGTKPTFAQDSSPSKHFLQIEDRLKAQVGRSTNIFAELALNDSVNRQPHLPIGVVFDQI